MGVVVLTIPEEMAGLTFMVRHSAACPKPYEVRLTGSGLLATVSWLGTISRQYGRHPPIDSDDVGYGMTLLEAAENALAAQRERKDAPQRRAKRELFKQLWAGV